MVDNQKKILANLIKKDLQDVLTNDSRWKREGFSYYFQDYWKWGGEEIWINTDNEELKKELGNNCLRNWDRRIAKIDQREKEPCWRWLPKRTEWSHKRIRSLAPTWMRDESEGKSTEKDEQTMDRNRLQQQPQIIVAEKEGWRRRVCVSV